MSRHRRLNRPKEAIPLRLYKPLSKPIQTRQKHCHKRPQKLPGECPNRSYFHLKIVSHREIIIYTAARNICKKHQDLKFLIVMGQTHPHKILLGHTINSLLHGELIEYIYTMAHPSCGNFQSQTVNFCDERSKLKHTQ